MQPNNAQQSRTSSSVSIPAGTANQIEPSQLHQPEGSNINDGRFIFYAISDFGVPNASTRKVAQAMNDYANQPGNRKPDVILGLGDNFYPKGVSSVSDPQFNSAWYDIFLRHYENLRVPWKMVLGNHDYMGNPPAQIDFHYEKQYNRGGFWQMPAACYTFGQRIYPQAPNTSSAVVMNTEGSGMGANENPSSLSNLRANDETYSSSFSSENVPPPSSASRLVSRVVSTITTSLGGGGSRANSIGSKSSSTEQMAGAFDVQFFALDTNGCQGHVRRQWPNMQSSLHRYVEQLGQRLRTSPARWKIVMGHHPMYTQGYGHGACARCLRDKVYYGTSTYRTFGEYFTGGSRAGRGGHGGDCDGGAKREEKRRVYTGYGLEDVLVGGGSQAYFAGHEHVFQYHHHRGVHNFICGASGAEQRPDSGLYGGEGDSEGLDWVGGADDVGFVASEIRRDSMQVRFISEDGCVLREIIVPHSTDQQQQQQRLHASALH